MKSNWATTGRGRPIRSIKLRNPELSDAAFDGAWEIIDPGFDDIEAAEREAIESVRKRNRRAPMLDETTDL